MTKHNESDTLVYVIRDASGEYVRHAGRDAAGVSGGRTLASDEAVEFETRKEAEAACRRATDKVLAREIFEHTN